jgi:hypothetical protein
LLEIKRAKKTPPESGLAAETPGNEFFAAFFQKRSLALLDRVDIQRVQMNALTMDSIERKALEVCS